MSVHRRRRQSKSSPRPPNHNGNHCHGWWYATLLNDETIQVEFGDNDFKGTIPVEFTPANADELIEALQRLKKRARWNTGVPTE